MNLINRWRTRQSSQSERERERERRRNVALLFCLRWRAHRVECWWVGALLSFWSDWISFWSVWEEKRRSSSSSSSSLRSAVVSRRGSKWKESYSVMFVLPEVNHRLSWPNRLRQRSTEPVEQFVSLEKKKSVEMWREKVISIEEHYLWIFERMFCFDEREESLMWIPHSDAGREMNGRSFVTTGGVGFPNLMVNFSGPTLFLFSVVQFCCRRSRYWIGLTDDRCNSFFIVILPFLFRSILSMMMMLMFLLLLLHLLGFLIFVVDLGEESPRKENWTRSFLLRRSSTESLSREALVDWSMKRRDQIGRSSFWRKAEETTCESSNSLSRTNKASLSINRRGKEFTWGSVDFVRALLDVPS